MEQVDKILDDSKKNPELAAAWLLDANRLVQLYKLRCAAGLSTCEKVDKVFLSAFAIIFIYKYSK